MTGNELSYKIIRAALQVRKSQGHGLIYRDAFVKTLRFLFPVFA